MTRFVTRDKMSPLRILRALFVTSAFALGLSTGHEAKACGNEVERVLTPVQHVAVAESFLDNARWGEAASIIRAQYPLIRTLGPTAAPLALRAQRIYALALVRADGRLDSGLGWTRWANFEWAIETLAELDKKRGDDPRAHADLAEARTRLPRTRAEATRVLEDLDQRDLLGSPFAYMALARARRASGDDGGASAAMRRCSMVSTEPRRCATDFMGEPTGDRG
jgi:hypothetical protein